MGGQCIKNCGIFWPYENNATPIHYSPAIFPAAWHYETHFMPTIELSIVVPIFEEESTIPLFLQRMIPILETITKNFEILFCMDPGRDNTRHVIETFIQHDKRIRLMVFSRRFGQPAATIAGIECCLGEACVVIDVDLQDPPELVSELCRKWKDGYDVVYAQRRSRGEESFIKRCIAYTWYKVINYIADVPIPPNTGDFRLISRKVIESLRGLRETHGFLRGLVAFVGYQQTAVLYDRDPRPAGRSKYNRFTGSFRIGMNGLISFSSKLLTLSSVLGVLASALSFVIAIWYLLQKMFFNPAITPGLPTIVIAITFFGGIQLISLGIVGEYIGRIYDEVRCRPKYMVAEKVNFPEQNL